MNEYNFQSGGYRVIPGCPGYVMSADLDVWSIPRRVRCKGGGTALRAAKRLRPNDGRVSLSHNGKPHRYHVARDLFPDTFPDLFAQQREANRQRPQAICRHGHLLTDPIKPEVFGSLRPTVRVASWGTGNRICLWCNDPPATFDAHTYSLAYGAPDVPYYSDLPAQPKLSKRRPGDGDRHQLAELEWGQQGFAITNSP